jgi:hypothetical protein
MMKNPNQAIYEPADFVNHAVQDIWIEGYLETLERWRIQLSAEGIVLSHLRDAWSAYGKFRQTGNTDSRRSAWRAIDATAAALRRVRQFHTP